MFLVKALRGKLGVIERRLGSPSFGGDEREANFPWSSLKVTLRLLAVFAKAGRAYMDTDFRARRYVLWGDRIRNSFHRHCCHRASRQTGSGGSRNARPGRNPVAR